MLSEKYLIINILLIKIDRYLLTEKFLNVQMKKNDFLFNINLISKFREDNNFINI